MIKEVSFAVITKIWGFFCVLIAVSLGKDVILSCILTITAFLHLVIQGKWKMVFNYGIFYILLWILLYAIQHRGPTCPALSVWSRRFRISDNARSYPPQSPDSLPKTISSVGLEIGRAHV